jgi:hypothetical protein
LKNKREPKLAPFLLFANQSWWSPHWPVLQALAAQSSFRGRRGQQILDARTSIGIAEGPATNMPTKDQAETMVTMLDAEWTLAAIAAHFGVDVKEVEQAIVNVVKSERNQADEQRRGK